MRCLLEGKANKILIQVQSSTKFNKDFKSVTYGLIRSSNTFKSQWKEVYSCGGRRLLKVHMGNLLEEKEGHQGETARVTEETGN